MKIIEFDKVNFIEDIKELLLNLQQYIVSIDKDKLNFTSEDFKEKYYEKTINEVYSNKGKIFLAIENGCVLGMICGFIYSYNQDDYLDYICPKKGFISELIVNKNYRNKGVGKLLLRKMEDYFKSIDCKYIQLDVFAFNYIAENFYKKNNYEDRMKTLFKKL